MSKTIPLTGGRFAIVDDDVFERIGDVKWHVLPGAAGHVYAARKCGGRRLLMHREILHAEKGQFVDHINGDGLDNRRENLRVCTRSQNMGNCFARKRRAATQYKGVCQNKNRWTASIARVSLGSFKTAEQAARAYDDAARKKWGAFARLNFPQQGELSCDPSSAITAALRELGAAA